jgi:thioredoxin reductase (NADPH)
MGRGVSHCASCDAPMLREKVVGLVGGGDSAAQEALTLAESVAEVIVFQRDEELTAQASFVERVLGHPKISVRYRTTVEEILGEGSVSGVRVHDHAAGTDEEIELASVFCYVGLQPNSDTFGEAVQLDSAGHVPTDGSMRTEAPGLFAAGYVRSNPVGRAAAAAGEGATAAVAADRFLAEGAWNATLAGVATVNGGSNG